MKRRAKPSEEWADLVQAGNSDDDDQGNKKGNGGRMGKVGFRVMAGTVILFVALSVLKIRSKTTTTTISSSSSSSLSTQNLIVDTTKRQGSSGGKKRRNRKVVLLGPHDRYNDFGDILAERVVTKLLVDRAGFVYNEEDDGANNLLLGGIVTRNDMDGYGLTPHKTVHSMKEIQKLSREDKAMGPYDIVFTGGSGEGPGDEGPSILYEKHRDAAGLLETEALRSQASANRVYDCPYLFPKELLLPVAEKAESKKHKTGSVHKLRKQKKNYAIVDSLETTAAAPAQNKKGGAGGGGSEKGSAPLACRRVTTMADHVGYRSSKPFAPDSTVLTRELFGAEIEALFENEVRPELLSFPEFTSETKDDKEVGGVGSGGAGGAALPIRYIAVQHESIKHTSDPSYAQDLADALDEVSRKLGNAPVVFFPAGRVGRPVGDHLAFGMSRAVSEKMGQPSVLYEIENALKVAALIRGAEAVLSTNLHVLILSFVYQKPRASWHGGRNHESFLGVWEAKNVASMGMLSDVGDTWEQGLRPFFGPKGSSKRSQTEAANRNAVQHYLENFEKWSKLLITPTNKGDDDDEAPTRHRTVLLR